MYSPPLRSFIVLLFTAGLLLTACQVPLPMLPDLSDVDNSPMAEETMTGEETVGADSTETTSITESMSESVQEDSNGESVDEAPNATIVVSSLRMRSGPGTEYEIVGAAPAGDVYPIIGQAFGCGWLHVEHPTFGSVWMSGAAQFTSMNVDCAEIPESTDIPAPPPPPPTPEPAPEAPAEPEAASPAQAESSAPTADSPSGLPNDMGCYLFQNFVGPELNITVTAKDWAWADNFRVPEGGVKKYCFAPGRYAMTADAPPPWNSINIDLHVKAGEHYLFPFSREE